MKSVDILADDLKEEIRKLRWEREQTANKAAHYDASQRALKEVMQQQDEKITVITNQLLESRAAYEKLRCESNVDIKRVLKTAASWKRKAKKTTLIKRLKWVSPKK